MKDHILLLLKFVKIPLHPLGYQNTLNLQGLKLDILIIQDPDSECLFIPPKVTNFV